MGKRKQKHKSTREPQISANNTSARKRAKQDVVHRMVVIYLESKTRGDFYGNVKKIINDDIAVSSRMKQDSLKRLSIRRKKKIGNNQIIYK